MKQSMFQSAVDYPKELLVYPDEVKQISKDDLNWLHKGEVLLVRSDYAYEKYGDHFSLLTGGQIVKPRGLRPNLITLPPLPTNNILNSFVPFPDGAIILLLDRNAADRIMKAYGIHLSEGSLRTETTQYAHPMTSDADY